ncbi:uncharacterized protein ARB_01276 [Trichophyton benhamiae CBS 112371]|uniref:Uncharacterized protein n=1 Tax=Arthroderma benhamiae (strain ATCC MYA-4681 / CBS 112371) TaxID=663331 RepID=D4AYK7_ARTBC|nr:uncharacterized protein ARB_01276 [Trichophyton benhamiae CBS 112371]EFE31677.1 hypothetical protein ARB_01276 [Trichophyton benhamiae CBS 112371]
MKCQRYLVYPLYAPPFASFLPPRCRLYQKNKSSLAVGQRLSLQHKRGTGTDTSAADYRHRDLCNIALSTHINNNNFTFTASKAHHLQLLFFPRSLLPFSSSSLLLFFASSTHGQPESAVLFSCPLHSSCLCSRRFFLQLAKLFQLSSSYPDNYALLIILLLLPPRYVRLESLWLLVPGQFALFFSLLVLFVTSEDRHTQTHSDTHSADSRQIADKKKHQKKKKKKKKKTDF